MRVKVQVSPWLLWYLVGEGCLITAGHEWEFGLPTKFSLALPWLRSGGVPCTLLTWPSLILSGEAETSWPLSNGEIPGLPLGRLWHHLTGKGGGLSYYHWFEVEVQASHGGSLPYLALSDTILAGGQLGICWGWSTHCPFHLCWHGRMGPQFCSMVCGWSRALSKSFLSC